VRLAPPGAARRRKLLPAGITPRYFKVTPYDLRRCPRYLAPERPSCNVQRPNQPARSRPTSLPGRPSRQPRRPKIAPIPAKGLDWTSLPALPSRRFQPRIRQKDSQETACASVSRPWKTLPLVSARLLIPGGTADDPGGQAGPGPSTSTMLDSTNRDATELAEASDALAHPCTSLSLGSHGAETLSTLSRNLDPTLAIVGRSLVVQPRFTRRLRSSRRAASLGPQSKPDSGPFASPTGSSCSLLNGRAIRYGNPADGTGRDARRCASRSMTVKAFP